MPSNLTRTQVALKLGDDTISALVHHKPPDSLALINVHHDETTSVAAGLALVEKHGGRLIEFVHPGGRLLAFRLDGQSHSFDPNRIFSDAGIKATLERFGTWSSPAHAAIKLFAAEYIARLALDGEPVILALHNATDGVFSIRSYLPGGEHGTASEATHVNLSQHRFNFFYATDRRFYEYLKARDYNVTLQDNRNAPDDGSLSVYFGRKGIPYLNIEAEMGRLDDQIAMVETAREMVQEIIGRRARQ